MDIRFEKSHRIRFILGLIILIQCFLVVLLANGCRKKESVLSKQPAETESKTSVKTAEKAVLRSQLADRGWYSIDANALNKQIEDFYEKADVKPIEDVIALILPHAGYRFSGQTAAYGIKTADKKYKRIVVIGPSHYLNMEEILSVPRVTHYETPLGLIPLDVEFIDKLLKFEVFQNVPHAHQPEHSVQIELPLLQYKYKDFNQNLR